MCLDDGSWAAPQERTGTPAPAIVASIDSAGIRRVARRGGGWGLGGERPDGAPVRYWQLPAPPPPPPVPGSRYASVGLRFAALLIDAIPLLIVASFAYVPAMAELFGATLRAISSLPPAGATDPARIQALMLVAMRGGLPKLLRGGAVVQLCTLAYFGGGWLILGRSPGMALLGLRIVREEDGGRPGPGRVAVRYTGFLLSAAPLFLGFAWALLDPRRQAWHDKLAGTLVLADRRGPAPGSGEGHGGEGTTGRQRRPSIGAVFDRGWAIYRGAPGGLFLAVGPFLLLGLVVLLPLTVVSLVLGQDQLLGAFRSIGATNVQLMAAAVPSLRADAGLGILAGPVGAVFVAACAAAVGGSAAIAPPGRVVRVVLARLPVLLALGLAVGVATAATPLLVAAVEGVAASGTDVPVGVGLLAGLSFLAAVVLVPASLYLSAVVGLAAVCLVREDLGSLAAIGRAHSLAHGNLRWLLGLVIVAGLAVSSIVGPIATLPLGVLSEAYLAGDRVPVVLSIVLDGLLGVVVAPFVGLLFLVAYEVSRESRTPGRPTIEV